MAERAGADGPVFGSTYPTADLGTDPSVLAAWARGLEEIGFGELYVPEHVVGVNAEVRADWRPLNPHTLQADKPIYDHRNPFLEPLVAMGFLAGVTHSITLMSGVLVAPQRQTALLAKQAAIADVLSGGRIRLGIGVGWNDAEFAALGADFRTRGRRMDEQIALLRRLWTEETVSAQGRWDNLDAVGICPLPVQRPIPLVVGGDSDAALDRAAARGDGWFLTHTAAESVDRTKRFWDRVDELGRRAGMSLVGTIYQGDREPEAMLDEVAAWVELGATHLNIRTASYPAQWTPGQHGRKTDVAEHIDALRRLRAAWLAR
ncbi:LLM class F420-dependent oxidoreductase [Streptosporangium sp. NPDC002544]|uniref:LLM class F420-dependent oxidoreductase n=1 Tax=Streptosporangium sp. NPDC002544 TaxID=3154538 RepID=UPI00331F6DCC